MTFVGLAMVTGLLVTPTLAQETLEAFEAAAMTGDYQAQRNAAYCLASAQCTGIIAPRKLDACAWRFVILAAGHKAVDDSDVGNYESDCVRRLSATERAVAQRKADSLFRQIYNRPLTDRPEKPSL